MTTHVINLEQYQARTRGSLMLGTWGSYGLEQLNLVYGDGWEGRTVTAVFHGPKTSDGVKVLADRDGFVQVPQEATANAGRGTITIVGVNEDSQRITVDVPYTVKTHAPVNGNTPEPTPSEWQQFVAQVKADADKAAQSSSAAEKSAQQAGQSKDAAASSADEAEQNATAAEKSAQAAAESAKQAAQATADIGEAKDDALEAIQQAQDTGVQAVEGATKTGVQAIQTAHQAALDDIEAAGDKQTAAITSGGAAALEAIGQVEQAAIGQVQEAGAAQVDAVNAAGQAQQTSIEQAGQGWQQQIEAAGTAELGRWAPAIWDIDPLAAEHDIYAVAGAPLRVVQQGATVQQTTTGAQLLDIGAGVADGWNIENIPSPLVAGQTYTYANVDSAVASALYASPADGSDVRLTAYIKAGGSATFEMPTLDGEYTLLIGGNGAELSKESKYMLNVGSTALPWEPYTGGKPSPSPDYPQAIKGIDSPVTAQTSDGQTTRSISMDIGTPLYGDDGVTDTVDNDVPSGCDKAIIVDGTMTFSETGSGDTRYWNLPNGSTPGGVPKSWCMSTLGGQAFYTSNGGTRAFSMPSWVPFDTVEELNAYCQEIAAKGTPLKIWYRSTAYTKAADMHIDKIKRRWKMLELDGSEAWNKLSEVNNGYQMPLTGGVDNLLCTHLIHSTTTSDGTIYLNATGLLRVYGPWSTTVELTTWLAAQKAAGTPVKVLYQLETPEVYAGDPHTLPALGALPETVKATGQSTVEYSADTKHYIDSKLQAIAAQQLNLMIGGNGT